MCASEIISSVPCRPRALRPRRKLVQNAPDSLSPTSKPRTSRRPSADTGGDHDCLSGDPAAAAAPVPADPGLAERRVQEHIRERALGQGPVPERGHLNIEIGAEPGHFTLGDEDRQERHASDSESARRLAIRPMGMPRPK